MTEGYVLRHLTEPDLARLAQDLAFILSAGDAIALTGDVGAGKTTFARAFIRAAAGDPSLEAPSPTFTLAQSYDAPRYRITHYDLYRVSDVAELEELGIEAALSDGVALIEWAERAGGDFAAHQWRISFDETEYDDRRTITVAAGAAAMPRLQRLVEIRRFLDASGWGGAPIQLKYLQGDASPRRYARLIDGAGRKAILMDAPASGDGPPIRDGKPYSRIAHLAEDVRAFAAVATGLRDAGLSAPAIFAHDLDQGFLLIEDFGDEVFGAEVLRGRDQAELWRRGLNVLIALARKSPPGNLPLPDGDTYTLPRLDAGVLQVEAELLLDWYWPAMRGAAAPSDVRDAFFDAWRSPFDAALSQPYGWLLRDFHSPNLIAINERAPPKDVGLIDFQDALHGPLAYDLASLLQDARVDAPAELERRLLKDYVEAMQKFDASFDADRFAAAYAIFGAQRATKILGIFARLAIRDGKPRYLAHMPRIWGYLERNLAHPALAPVRAWYDAHIPAETRRRQLAI